MSDDQKDQVEETKEEKESLDVARDKEVKEEKAKEVKEEVREEKKEEKSVYPEQGRGAESDKKSVYPEQGRGAESKPKKSAPSGKFKDLIKSIEELSVLELAELVKELEERFGVSAAQPMMAAGAMPAAGGAGAPVEEEKANYTVHLVDAGAQKIAVIKAIREIRQDLGLKEAKDLVDGAPKDVKVDVPKVEAEEAKKKLEVAGAKVELK